MKYQMVFIIIVSIFNECITSIHASSVKELSEIVFHAIFMTCSTILTIGQIFIVEKSERENTIENKNEKETLKLELYVVN